MGCADPRHWVTVGAPRQCPLEFEEQCGLVEVRDLSLAQSQPSERAADSALATQGGACADHACSMKTVQLCTGCSDKEKNGKERKEKKEEFEYLVYGRNK